MQLILNTIRNSWSLDRGKIRRTRSIAEFRSETEVDTFRAFIYGKKKKKTDKHPRRVRELQRVEPLKSIDVTSSWGRGEREKSSSPHNTTLEHNNFPPWRGRTAAIQHARAYNNFPLLQSLSLKRWQWIVPLRAYWSHKSRHIPPSSAGQVSVVHPVYSYRTHVRKHVTQKPPRPNPSIYPKIAAIYRYGNSE